MHETHHRPAHTTESKDPDEESSKMPRMASEVARDYSIRLAARMSGISAHTLRMWERRYGFPQPARTPGGARRYSAEDVHRLKRVAEALELGYRAGDVVAAKPADLERLIAEQRAELPGLPAQPSLAEAVRHVERGDPAALRALLRVAVATLGVGPFVSDFAAPLLDELGARWARGEIDVHQEHIASEVLASQLRALLSAYDAIESRPRVLLTTFEGEQHGLGLLLAALTLALRGATPRLMGVSTPVAEIAAAARALDADVVGLSLAGGIEAKAARQQLRKLRKLLGPDLTLWLGGRGVDGLSLRDGEAELVPDATSLQAALERWRAQR